MLLKLYFSFLMLVGAGDYKFGNEVPMGDLNNIIFYDVQDFKINNDITYIADFKGLYVYAFDSKGNLINKSGGSGRGPGEFVHGPRIVTPAADKVFSIGMMPFIYVYDKYLNYETTAYFINDPISSYDMYYLDNKLYMSVTQFKEYDAVVYDFDDDSSEKFNLKFELYPGLLAQYSMLEMRPGWLFAWNFQNKFKLYDKDLKLIREFSIQDLPEKAEGQINELRMIPNEVNSHQRQALQLGTFTPHGSFFTGFTKLSSETFIVQLGTLTGGHNKALIINLEGEIIQEIDIPITGKIMGYSKTENVLYFYNSSDSKISAYEFYNR